MPDLYGGVAVPAAGSAVGGAAAELCLHPGGRGGAVLHGEAADRAVLARVDGGGLLAALRRRAGHGGVHPDVQPDDAGGHRAFVLPCGFVAGAAGGAKAAAGGLAGSVCGHNGRGADAVFLFGVLLFRLWAVRRFKTAGGYVIAEFAALAAAYAAFPTMKAHIFSGSRGKEAFASVFDLSALAEWGRSIGTVVQLLAAQFGGLWLWAVVVAAAAVVLWRRGCRLRGNGLFAAGLLLASAGYVALIDKAAPFEADRYYVVIYAAVVLAVAVVLARLAPQHETLLLLALVPILAAHRTDPNAYLYEDAAPRKAALADTERLPAVVLNKAGYEVAPDLFLEEFAKREAVDQASGEDDAASLRAAVALCCFTQSMASRQIRRLKAQGNLQNIGKPTQPIYIPTPGHYEK